MKIVSRKSGGKFPIKATNENWTKSYSSKPETIRKSYYICVQLNAPAECGRCYCPKYHISRTGKFAAIVYLRTRPLQIGDGVLEKVFQMSILIFILNSKMRQLFLTHANPNNSQLLSNEAKISILNNLLSSLCYKMDFGLGKCGMRNNS